MATQHEDHVIDLSHPQGFNSQVIETANVHLPLVQAKAVAIACSREGGLVFGHKVSSSREIHFVGDACMLWNKMKEPNGLQGIIDTLSSPMKTLQVGVRLSQ